jgi:hypothetical protein
LPRVYADKKLHANPPWKHPLHKKKGNYYACAKHTQSFHSLPARPAVNPSREPERARGWRYEILPALRAARHHGQAKMRRSAIRRSKYAHQKSQHNSSDPVSKAKSARVSSSHCRCKLSRHDAICSSHACCKAALLYHSARRGVFCCAKEAAKAPMRERRWQPSGPHALQGARMHCSVRWSVQGQLQPLPAAESTRSMLATMAHADGTAVPGPRRARAATHAAHACAPAGCARLQSAGPRSKQCRAAGRGACATTQCAR